MRPMVRSEEGESVALRRDGSRVRSRTGTLTLTAVVAVGSALWLAPSAGAAFPGQNGRIVFDRYVGASTYADIIKVKPDGSDAIKLTRHSPSNDDYQPACSPDGQKITWTRDGDIWIMNDDGTGQRRLTRNDATEY